jgi:F420-non-reducing hydrogenase large subunit
VDGEQSGIYRVAPLARLNASDGLATPKAQAEHDRMYDTLGGKPAHNTLAYHWARLVEMLYAAERMVELMSDPDIMGTGIRTLPTEKPSEGVGVVEAPRGTLIHHFKSDERGVITQANLIVATVNNAPGICMSVQRAAKGLIKNGNVSDGLLNMVEMAFRAYDPCFACASHSLPGRMPLVVEIKGPDGKLIRRLSQFVD